jgi:hypothetical protein
MSATELPLAQEDLKNLSDKELIQAYCAIPAPRQENSPAQAIVKELWDRHGKPVVYRALRILTFAECGLCPGFYDRITFLDSCFSQAYINFTRRLCGFRLEGPFFENRFHKWLETVARTAALDERRKIVGRQTSGPDLSEFPAPTSTDTEACEPVASNSAEEAQPVQRTFEPYDPELHDQQIEGANLSSLLGRAQPLPTPHAGVMAKERKLIVCELLKQHAAASDENAQSAYTIRLRHWSDWTLSKIGAHFFGDPGSDVERNNLEVRIRRVLLGDYKKLRILLAQSSGITSLPQI